MPEPEHPNGVRITNREIFDELTGISRQVASVKQTVERVLEPGLQTALTRIESLDKNKADKEIVVKTDGRVERIEMRMYAIMSGLIAALLGAKGLGLL